MLNMCTHQDDSHETPADNKNNPAKLFDKLRGAAWWSSKMVQTNLVEGIRGGSYAYLCTKKIEAIFN